MKRQTVIVIALIFVLMLIITFFMANIAREGRNISRQVPSAESTPEQLQTVDASSLASSYSRNEVRADEIYKRKTFFITGEIKDIGKTITGKPYLILKGDEESYTDVQVIFERSEKDKIAELSKRNQIKAKAICDGLTLGNVILSDAEIR